MSDLIIAKKIFAKNNMALVIVKHGELLFESDSSGITSFLGAIDVFGKELFDASIADRFVGRAAGLLAAYSHIKNVYAEVISLEGLKVMEEVKTHVEFKSLVPMILNLEKNDVCPFERYSLGIKSIEESYDRLKHFSENFKK